MLGDQVLIRENDQVKAAQVKEVSNIELQGNQSLNIHFYDVFCLQNIQNKVLVCLPYFYHPL